MHAPPHRQHEGSSDDVRRRLLPALLLAMAFCACFLPILSAAGTPGSSYDAAPAAGIEQGPEYAKDRLVGTMRAGSFSGAVFEDPSGKQTFYRAGATFSDGTRILSVKRRRILVETADGSRVEYFVKGGKPGKSATADHAGNRRQGRTKARNAGGLAAPNPRR